MKKSIRLFIFLCLWLAFIFAAAFVWVNTCQAAPFLVCDVPPADQQVASYIIYKDGVEYAHIGAETDGSLRLDLYGLAPGEYTWTARAVNAWGKSDLSDPYVSPSGAGKPQNTRMVP